MNNSLKHLRKLTLLICRHHKKKKERKVREKKYSSSQSADEESDKERNFPGNFHTVWVLLAVQFSL